MKYSAFALAAAALLGGCRMAPIIQAPVIRSSEFGLPLARAGDLSEADIAKWDRAQVDISWPATLAVLQVHRDNRYVALSQEEWDPMIRASGAIKGVNILDGLGVGDESLHGLVARHDDRRREGPPESQPQGGALFVPERWIASAAKADLVFLYATKVATDTYWNHWAASWLLIVTIPFTPAEEQTAQAVSKGFLVDVKTGKILETAGATAMQSRTANPVIVSRPIFQLEQEVAREAETRMIAQLTEKLRALQEREK